MYPAPISMSTPTNKSNRIGWLAVVAGLLIVCLCFAVTGAGFAVIAARNHKNVTASNIDDTGTNTSSRVDAQPQAATPVASDTKQLPLLTATAGPSATAQLVAIEAVQLPREDLANIAVRYKGVSAAQANPKCAAAAPGYEIGATRAFTLSNQDKNTQFEVQARLEYKTDHAYMWVQTAPRRVQVSASHLRAAADAFEKNIYPTNRAFFGTEASPGVDCDVHVHVLHVIGVGSTVGGYFSSPDSYPRAVRSDSNEGQMFVVNSSPGYTGSNPNSEQYLSTLAHEFQHMISYNQTDGKALWLEEGAAQFAERLNGYADAVGTPFDFAAQPETQLNTWEESSAGGNARHYGGGYLFWSYLYDRFGPDVTKALARNPDRSGAGIMQALSDQKVTNPDTGTPFSFEQLFTDFVVANWMGRTKVEPSGKRYNYSSIDVPPMAVHGTVGRSDIPFNVRESLPQFGTHYYELSGNKPITISFKGATAVRLLPTDANTGAFWWSNRADQSNPRLTREIDLTKVQDATLKFRAMYRLEKDYDYAYVSISQDGGATWKTLKTTTCTTENKQNANLGCGFNGASGVSSSTSASLQWIDEQASLKAYAGKKVLLRFETITDAGVNREGLAIDDIAIPEIGFKDNADSTDADWKSEGWVRVENVLPQSWAVQAIVTKRDGSREVRRTTTGTLSLDLGGDIKSAVLAVSATTQVTTEPGSYELSIR